METTSIVHELNILLRKNYLALQQCQMITKANFDWSLHEYFNRKANERYVFGHQLKHEIQRLGGEVYDTKTLKNLNIVSWVNYKSAVKAKDKNKLMARCEKGERLCIADYNALLDNTQLCSETKKLLQQQRNDSASTSWKIEIENLLARIEDFSFFSDFQMLPSF